MANATKQAILEEAFHLFAVNGFEATSMNDIAREVGITKPAIYTYFDGKEDLALRILEQVQSAYRAYMQEVIAQAERISDVEKRLYHLFERYVAYFCEHKQVSAFWLRMIFFPPPVLREKLSGHMNDTEDFFLASLTKTLRAGMRQGLLRKANVTNMALSFYAMREGMLMLLAHKLGTPTIKALWRDFWLGIKASGS